MADTDLPQSPETPAPSPAGEQGPAASPSPVPPEEEVNLNELFPESGQDLNALFPEKELRTLLLKVHKSRKDLARINTRFVDNTEDILPEGPEPDEDPEGPADPE